MDSSSAPLHPLLGTVAACPGDTSVDTSLNKIQDESDLSEPRQVRAVWGEVGRDTQGPAGAPVPDDLPSEPDFEDLPDVADRAYGYADDPSAPEDAAGEWVLTDYGVCSTTAAAGAGADGASTLSAGPSPRWGGHLGPLNPEELQDPEAYAAASAAERIGRKSTHAMLQLMDEAEAKYEEQHPPEEAPPGTLLHPKHAYTPLNPPSPELRSKVQERLRQALEGRGRAADPSAAAAQCEEAMHRGAAGSTAVYQSVASNAVRVAPQVGSVEELLRVAMGQPAGGDARIGSPAVADHLSDLSGLQGVALKWDYT